MKILILSGSTGGGHNRASNALKDYILANNDDAVVEIVDSLKYCSSLYNKTITVGYHTLATKAPDLYGVFYKGTDKRSPLDELVSVVNTQIGKKLLPLIEKKHPDLIVCCHPFASKMMSHLKSQYSLSTPVISVITDFMPHRAYIGENIDAFVTASESTTRELVDKYGIDKNRVYTYGIPIFSRFFNCDENTKSLICRNLGIDESRKTVLIMAGSFGVTDILKIYENLVELDLDYQIIIITGKNKKLYDAFEKMLNRELDEFETQDYPEIIEELPEDGFARELYDKNEQLYKDKAKRLTRTFKRSTNKTKPTKLLYFVDNVDDYMHISDLIITKPGGLTTSESLACGLPMAIFKAFPGQEAQNADFLVDSGTAIMLEKGAKGAAQIRDLLTNSGLLHLLSQNCIANSHPDSCEKIYELILNLLSKDN